MSIAAPPRPPRPAAPTRRPAGRRRLHALRLGVGLRGHPGGGGGLLPRGRSLWGRLLVGTAVLGAAHGRPRLGPADRREWSRLAVCGVGWFGIYNVALNAAEQHLDAGTTAMLVNIGPILIAVFAGPAAR